MLNGEKNQNLKLHNPFNIFHRVPPQEYACILGSKSAVFIQRKCHLKLLLPHGKNKQEAQGLGALLDKMEDNDHIKLDSIEI